MKIFRQTKAEILLGKINDLNFDKWKIENRLKECELELEKENKKLLIKLGWKKEVKQLDNILKKRGFNEERDLRLFYPKVGEKILLSESEIETLAENVRMWEKKQYLELDLE